MPSPRRVPQLSPRLRVHVVGSRTGGERAVTFCSVIQTCKANGVDPHAYITDVISKVADDWPASRWDELMPWNGIAPADRPIMQAA